MSNYLVGTDVGTQGTKSVVMDEDGSILAGHYIDYPLVMSRSGCVEHDPRDYWKAVAGTIFAAVKESKADTKHIRGVSISALSPACILIDRNLNPLQNAHIWMDRRATAECRWLKEKIGEDFIFELTGNPIDPYYASTKLMWEKNNRPELYKEAYRIQTAADYPVAQLTGTAVTDYSNASLFGIVFDIVNRKWDEGLIERIGLDAEKFPEPYPCDEVIGEVTAAAAEETGLAPGTPVVAGTVDYNAASLAMGIMEDGDICFVMGTGGVWGVVHDEPRFTRNLVTIVPTAYSRTRYTTNATFACTGALLRYFRDQFCSDIVTREHETGINAYELMGREAEKIPPGSDGLIVLPYFAGERAPIWDPRARGLLFGMTMRHGRGHVIRAMMESAGYAVLQSMELVREAGVQMNFPLFLGEGGAQSPLWRKIVSDILDCESVYIGESKGAPVGNAINAGVGTGVFGDYSVIKDWVPVQTTVKPDPEAHEVYMRLYRIYRQLYPALKEHFRDLAEIFT
jgi:xylulokinase